MSDLTEPVPCLRCGAPVIVPMSTFIPADRWGIAVEVTPGRVPCANCARLDQLHQMRRFN